MSRMNKAAFWRWICDQVRAYRPQLRFCLRTTTAGLLALALARTLDFPLHGLWAVLTAVVVTQISVGGSLRATIEYMVGTVGGAVYAAAIGVLIPHTTVIAQAFVLALTIAPLSFAAAINPSLRVAPFSAVLVLLIGGELGETPLSSAVTRVLEVALGGAVAVAVSLAVLPERANRLGRQAAAQVLGQMADALPRLLTGFRQNLDPVEISRIQGDLGSGVAAFEALTAETRRERMLSLVRQPDPAPLSRTLLRLQHDLVTLGLAAAMPLPGPIAQRLGPLIASVGAEASKFLRGTASALVQDRRPPPLEPVEASLKANQIEVESLRSEGLTRPLSTSEVERLFALGFALEQLCRNFADLAQRVREYSQGEGTTNGEP
jgi:uncharacterized membrane protein YccC